MIIVSGRIYVTPGRREHFLEKSMESVKLAREAKGCLDFVVAADPIEENRVNIYEEWTSKSELHAFRGSGPDSDINSLIENAHVTEHTVDSRGT